eukprot:gene14004-biopygen3809
MNECDSELSEISEELPQIPAGLRDPEVYLMEMNNLQEEVREVFFGGNLNTRHMATDRRNYREMYAFYAIGQIGPIVNVQKLSRDTPFQPYFSSSWEGILKGVLIVLSIGGTGIEPVDLGPVPTGSRRTQSGPGPDWVLRELLTPVPVSPMSIKVVLALKFPSISAGLW